MKTTPLKFDYNVLPCGKTMEITLNGHAIAVCPNDPHDLCATIEQLRRTPEAIPAVALIKPARRTRAPKPEWRPSFEGVARLFIELRSCDASVGRDRAIYADAAGRELDETPRPGYRRCARRNMNPDNIEQFEHRLQLVVRYYGPDGQAKRLGVTESGAPQHNHYSVDAALALLRRGYDLGFNDVHAEDRVAEVAV